MTSKAWSGRFEHAPDPRVEQFTESVNFDRRLYAQDIAASIAHAEMLAEVGLLRDDECRKIVQALRQIETEIREDRFAFGPQHEDIHMHIEQALIERLGDVGRKLHTARSRNDQISADMRLWVREAIDRLDSRLQELQSAMLNRASQDQDLVLPGYTHLQRAQPVLAAHYWLAYCEKWQRDRDRLADCRTRTNVSPLGTAALAGTTLPIDRQSVARKLGFAELARNSLDAASDRDFLAEFLFGLALVAVHLSGWAEEWILWSTNEFGFLELPEAYCTGSSIMPQKKNPDVLELIRGKSARVIGDLHTLLVLLKGLPLAYNRDLQEDKPPVFDAYDTVTACLEMAAPLVQQARWNAEAIRTRLQEGFLDATTLMEYLVAKGMPMRAAHEAVGKLVRRCEERGCRLADLTIAEFQELCPQAADDVYQCLGVENAVAAFRSFGSTGRDEVKRQIQWWTQHLHQRQATPPAGKQKPDHSR